MPDETRRWTRQPLTRRTFIAGAAVAPVAVIAGCSDDGDDPKPPATDASPDTTTSVASGPTPGSTGQTLEPTPECGDDDDDPTPDQTEGPFFTPNSPERASVIDAGLAGEPLVVTGRVLFTDCAPAAGALLDIWQCDNDGEYHNAGYTLRGHQFADDGGNFRLETIKPGLYTGRTRHIHVKVQAPNQGVLTTQIYFPDEPANATDGIFDDRLVMTMPDASTGQFDFVVTRV
jgi:protocatechuate 3,4-dioxygenase beta subunit